MYRTVARHLAVAAAVGVVVVALVTIGVWRYAAQDAHATAERVSRQVASAVLVPIAAHDYADPSRLDRAALSGYLAPFLRSGMVQRVKVFTVRDGAATVVYSDEPRTEGRVEGIHPALRAGDVRVQAVPDNAAHHYENSLAGSRMEVFFGFRDAGGADAGLELYVPVDVAGTTEHGVVVLLPVVLGGFVVVALLLLPVSFALARRVERDHEERRAMVRSGRAAAESARQDVARRL